MANSTGFQFRYSYERDMYEIYLKVSIGASGAPTIVNGKGVSSVVQTGTGAYTITLKENYNLLLGMDMVSISGASAPTAPAMNIVSETVNTVASPQILIQTRDIAAAAANPASGEVLMMRISVRNAST